MRWLADERVETIKKALMKMGWFTEKMFLKTLEALQTKDIKLAKQVIEDDSVLDEMEIEMRKEIILTLGIHQFSGQNLRFLVGAIQIASIFERIGDNARRMAQLTMNLLKDQPIKSFPGVVKMGDLAALMLKDSLRILADLVVEGAFEVCEKDAEIDELYSEIYNELVEDSKNFKDNLERNLIFLELCQHVEEIADLTANIVETVLYVVTGQAYKCFKDQMKLFERSEGVLFETSD
ncbi:phosphate signaling complex protein PhoU [Pseudothermotoga thermarum]|uniref:Phosphate uptake regulator, PhoU n=1 Tax=Pseudothermotoga thermarum DSM 5069 TaxID=688269 RepID=F7YXK3_9THEM|nr:phosphate signaling complex protein PhoU [Pseudothermotoga thermarum]AEH50644.1 phosphate uptake regulator, PhoU [Pseudothermotoga thermarum DSM 5069]